MGGTQFALWIPIFWFFIKVSFLPHYKLYSWDREQGWGFPLPPTETKGRVGGS